jgi:glycosyltransferase involved in cell wall biosynthesis
MHQMRFPEARESVLQKLLVFFERQSCRWADHVIAANESHKRVEQERSGIPASRITVVRNGPEAKHFAEVEPHPLFQESGRTVIGFVGQMGPLDGVEVLLRIFRSLRFDLHRDDWQGVLVGDGEVFDLLPALAAELGVADRVHFTGRVAFSEVVPLIRAMDICTIPDPLNVYTRHCTLIKAMEYMAQGKPIVAFDLPETRFSAADAATYVSHGDERGFAQALSDLMDDLPRREAMGRAGRKRAEEELAWRHWAPNLLAVYEQLTGHGRLTSQQVELEIGNTSDRLRSTANHERLQPADSRR